MTSSPRSLVAVLVATRDRSELLARCLSSVAAQTRRPDFIVVVDDGEPTAVSATTAIVGAELEEATVLGNGRSPGAAGAWNTGLSWLHEHAGDPSGTFVAIIDDDDEWTADHLASCLDAAERADLDLVASGLIRHDGCAVDGRRQSIPDSVDEEAVLIGNPHIQGSNLFVRLSMLLEVGLFDEALSSTTDRDLLIRILDLGKVRFGSTSTHTVHHHADVARPRLSTPGSRAKFGGLDRFWNKYRGRMIPDVQRQFLERSSSLFAWVPEELAAANVSPVPPVAAPTIATTPATISLVVGCVVDVERIASVHRLLDQLRQAPGFAAIDVVLVGNGPSALSALGAVVEQQRRDGLRCYLIGHDDLDGVGRGVSDQCVTPRGDRLSIAAGRTIVQGLAHHLMTDRPDAVAWIVDDDKVLLEPDALATQLRALRDAGVDVALGEDVGAPPLPAAASVRVQLVDLLHNLRWLSLLDPDAPLPDRSAENDANESSYRDYYADLGDTFAHLETPWWLTPTHEGETARDAVRRLYARVERILAGEQIFRPLVRGGTSMTPSVHRGGSTFVFNPSALAVPNPDLDLGFGSARRSDMVWAVLNRAAGRTIVRTGIAVLHDRSALRPNLDLDTVARDIHGHALYRALEAVHRDGRFDNDDGSALLSLFGAYLDRRLRVFDQSAHRIRGLVVSLRHWLQRSSAWTKQEELTSLHVVLDSVAETYSADRVAALLRKARTYDPAPLAALWRERASTLMDDDASGRLRTLLDNQRIEVAKPQVERVCDVAGLRPLGSGSEGVAFTDERFVYKYIDRWNGSREEQRRYLRDLVGRWPRARALYPLLGLHTDGIHTVLVYPYEPSAPYAGGYGPELIQLLRECRDYGVVYRNVHPKNLVVTASGVRLIDYGSDIRAFNDADFEQMCRRTWLTWRWHHRPDLAELMHTALTCDDIPELDGYQRFRSAVEVTDQRELDRSVEAACIALKPERVLDYGCGKGKVAVALAAAGLEVVGYDPDRTHEVRWLRPTPHLRFTAEREGIGDQPFDVVLASLVLCTLDESAYVAALSDMRQRVGPGGRVVVAVCNPFFTCDGTTTLQRREVPSDANPETVFAWQKELRASGERRRDVHRSWARLRRDFLRVGLGVESVSMTQGVDLERFEPSSDFLVATLRPLPPSRPVSLVIRTCAMEHATIDAQVRHLVDQLEGPHAFEERVVVVDSRADRFTREYTNADPHAHDAALTRLLDEGVIDRIEHLAESDAPALYRRWFDLYASATHSTTGAPLAATLYALETSASDYVLMVDADLLVSRDASADYLEKMLAVFDGDPTAISVALDICARESKPFTASGPDGAWRVEARASLLHRPRILRARPLPNVAAGDALGLALHRSLDELVATTSATSYRGAGGGAAFVHPRNEQKVALANWMLVMDRIEAGVVPEDQVGHVELVAAAAEWWRPLRSEPFVFVVTGRNVPPGRFLRCIESLRRQRGDWGVAIVDDGSTPSNRDFVALVTRSLGDRATLLRPRRRRGQLANMVGVIRHICTDPETVIVTLDADDALLGASVVDRLEREYRYGADVTIGSMLRTDKHVVYPVNLTDPRANRGGNVWQHLRSFRKRLFDGIPDDQLRLDGEYIDLAADWAYMLPIVEMARNPVFIPDPLYLHEPSGRGKGVQRPEREQVIARAIQGSRRP